MLCSIANYKVPALRRIRKYLTLEKAKLLSNAFENSKFHYAFLIWILKIEKKKKTIKL